MISGAQQTAPPAVRDVAMLAVLIALFFGFMLGNRPLSVPDEGRYVEIAREMAGTGDYVTPRLNGVKYFEKPVLFYWLEAFAVRLFGLHEFALRLWPAAFALFGCLCVYAAGRRLFGRRTGLLSAVVLATSLLYYAFSRAIILDMPVSVMLTASLLSFLAGVREAPGPRRRLLFWSFYAFAALAVLTKGLIGILIPAMIIGAWIVLLGEWRLLKSMHLASGLTIFLLLAAPWHIVVSHVNPEFPRFYFIQEHFLRYLTRMHGRYHPVWYFIPILALGLFPWIAFLVQAVRHSFPATWKERHEHRDTIFLLLWAGLVFLFFSASGSKLPPYILPVFPPLALLVGRYFADAWESRDYPGIQAGYVLLGILAVLLGGAFLALPRIAPEDVVRTLGVFRYSIAATLVLGAALAWYLARSRSLRHAFMAVAALAGLLLVQINGAAARVDTKSVKPLVATIGHVVKPGDVVATYATYYQDLPVYMNRLVTIVDWTGELEFGTTVEDTRQWMMNSPEFWKRWQGQETIFLFTQRTNYDTLRNMPGVNIFPVAEDQRTIVLCNREVHP
ncbi:MAG TPA: glycosyltransferase family 39 protein [Nitrospirota bacterium]|nr:glycosyltransferase family 39 protein [Nitrospirota bacterium]